VPTAPVYPVALVVEGKPCLVVGGGAVAARKVASLVECGADVTVVAPEVGEALRALVRSPGEVGGSVRVEARCYRPGEAARFRLVVTATGRSEVDQAVAHDADAAGVWVNSADDPARCSFLLPAVHRQGTVSIAVSTGGASPALAAWLRSRLARLVGPETSTIAQLLQRVRGDLRAAGRSTEEVDWQAVLDGEVATLVAAGRTSEAAAALRRAVGLTRSG
jgi:siroheme synthase-like protein